MMIQENTNDKLKVALVVPNFYWCDWDINSRWEFIPYNLCILAGMIKDSCEVVIIDANHENMTEQQLVDSIKSFNPDVVGLTVLMDQYGPAGHYAAKIIKENDATIKIVMGGVYATMNSEKVLEDSNIDFVVIGEGEYVFRELLAYISGTSAILPDKGIAYRDDKGKICNTGHSIRITDLDALPFPDYSLIDYASYISVMPARRSVDMPPKVPYARILTSRGCPYGCVFCQVEHISGKKFRSRSSENILKEIEWLKNTYGVQSLIFDDDNLFIDKKRAIAIFNGMVERGLQMPWVSIATSAFRIDEEVLDAMVASGCEYIDIAIESGNERVLKDIIGKPLDLDHAKMIAKAAIDRGVFVAANFVIGFPTETWDEILETIKFAEEININYVKIFAAIPLLNTRLWDLCLTTESFKKKFSDDALSWNTGQIETDQFTAKDITILRAYEWDRINFSTKEKRQRIIDRMHITVDELWEIRKRTRYAASKADDIN